MVTVDQVKLIGIPKNTSRLNNRIQTPVAIPNDSVNLYEAIKVVHDSLVAGDNPTDLSTSYFPTSVAIGSSTGQDTGIVAATLTTAGVMSAEDKQNLEALFTLTGMPGGSTHLGQFTGITISNNLAIKEALQELETAIETLAYAPPSTNISISHGLSDVTVESDSGTDGTINAATSLSAGVMSAADKTILDAHVTHWGNLDALTGITVTLGSADLGTFTGSTITDNVDIKTALQELETAVEAGSAADGNGIYSGSGSIPTAVVASVTDSFSVNIDTQGKQIKLGDINDNVPGGTTRIAGIGIDISAGNYVQIGGNFGASATPHFRVEKTQITMAMDSLNYFALNSAGPGELRINKPNFVITTNTPLSFQGLVYADDYSASYTTRSLVDKAYVDGITGVTTDITITQSNTTVTVNSSSGADGTIIAATSSTAGVMSSGDKRELTALVTLSGVASEAVNLGSFTGTVIQDNSTVKAALQDLETAIDAAKTGGNYQAVTANYTVGGDNRTIYAKSSNSSGNFTLTLGGLMDEGEIYYIYARNEDAFNVVLAPASSYSFWPSFGTVTTETTTSSHTVSGGDINRSYQAQRRGTIIFLTQLV